ncbi:MAG: polymer-forming cytoskeletal protein [Acidobacteriota bacterium]
MWKKTKDENPKPKSPPLGKSPIEQLKEQAVIGPSTSIKGELSGEEDLMIQGRVEGKIDLKKNNVTVGRKGHIKGDIYGKIISIEGEVQGNLFGEEKVVIRESGVVHGNMRTPRFSLEDGANFKGSIDTIPTMEKSSQH